MSFRTKLEELRRLREQGKTRAETYKIKEDVDIYDTLDEEQYQELQKKRALDFDFVVDDGEDSGYIENGEDKWETAVENTPKPKKQKKSAPDFFKRTRQVATPARSVAKTPASAGDVEDLIKSIGFPTPQTPTPLRKRNTVLDRPQKPSFVSRQVEEQKPEDDVSNVQVTPDTPEAPNSPTPEAYEPPSDPPVSSCSAMQPSEEVEELKSSLPTPHPSSDLCYAQNVVEISSEDISPMDAISGDQLRFYYTDFSEAGNNLLLYGKTGTETFQNTCVVVENLFREVNFLPGEGYTTEDVYEEVVPKLVNLAQMDICSRAVMQKYCFGENVPREAKYLQVRVPFKVREEDLTRLGGSTYSHMFGHTSSMFERFVLLTRVSGPSWLDISDFKLDCHNKATGSNITAFVDSKNVKVSQDQGGVVPPFTIMSFSVRTALNSKTKAQEVVAVSARFFKNVQYNTSTAANELPCSLISGVRPLGILPPKFASVLEQDQEKSKIKSISRHRSEKGLLAWFLTQIKRYDPDVILGHNIENIHLNVLLNRLKDLEIPTWHFIGRRGPRPQPNRVDSFSIRSWIPGRLICDISNDMGKSMTTKCDEWTLSEMAKLYLDHHREDYGIDIAKLPWNPDEAEGLIKIVRQNEMDTMIITSLALQIRILALSKELTNLAGNSWARTLAGSRVDRNEFILLREFSRQGYILPDKQRVKHHSTGRKAKYAGGRVFEPEKGLYRSAVLVMDFNSLYPSIIQEFNICFTTVDTSKFKSPEDGLPALPDSHTKLGLFPKLIQSLVHRRRDVKRLMKDPKVDSHERAQLEIRQQALKLTANSMYGCLGFEGSRFYALPLAMLTTLKGRETLESTKQLAENNNLKVIYGDTDSVMINTNVTEYAQALEIGHEFKRKVNSQYRMLEIDIDNVFGALLLNAKKKYAAVNLTKDKDGTITGSIEVKGLDLRRREYSDISKQVSNAALKYILESADLDAALLELHQYLEKIGEEISQGKISLHKFIIRNKLGKDPNAYADAEKKKLPHVAVALRKLSKGEIVKADDVIPYVICTGEGHPSERAFTAAEIREQNLVPDYEYYLIHQILPPVERICANVEGTDRIRLAECLGIDIKKHKISPPVTNTSSFGLVPFETTISDAERFKACEPFSLACGNGHEFCYNGFSDITPKGIQCPQCNYLFSDDYFLHSQIHRQMVEHIERYYAGETICDECHLETRQLGVMSRKCLNNNGTCPGRVSFKYSSKQLYSQLSYFQSLFDAERANKSAKLKNLAIENSGRYGRATQVICEYLENNGRKFVNMGSIFDLA